MNTLLDWILSPIRKILGLILTMIHQVTLPQPIQREVSQQAKVDQETQSLKLYHFEGCPFCLKVRREIRRLGLSVELRDIKKDIQFKEELLKGGGEYQVPCLRIATSDGSIKWMYESSEINQYLRSRFEHAI